MSSVVSDLGSVFSRHRSLLWEFSKRELKSRYFGEWFGTTWTIIHPLFLLCLYAFVFAVVLQVRLGRDMEMPLDYTAYILSGLIAWLLSAEAMIRGCTSITSNANLAKQVVFPLEILPVSAVVVAAIPAVIGFGFLLLYLQVTAQGPPATVLLLPLVMAGHLVMLLGLAFLLSAVTVFFRDLKDIVQLFTTAGVFLAPIVYLPNWLPQLFQPIIYVNPFSYEIWCYRDVLYFGHVQHLWIWLVFAALSVVSLAAGYHAFKATRPHFGSAL